ncbi:hypothetical protein Tco_0475323, partial [Tanacetum coccineum]
MTRSSGRWCGLTSTNSAVHFDVQGRRLFKLHQCFRICLKIGMLFGEADSELRQKGSIKKAFKTCCMNWGEVNPVHAYYNGSRTSKDNEDPSWSTSFKTRRTQKTSSALELLEKKAMNRFVPTCYKFNIENKSRQPSLLSESTDVVIEFKTDLQL